MTHHGATVCPLCGASGSVAPICTEDDMEGGVP